MTPKLKRITDTKRINFVNKHKMSVHWYYDECHLLNFNKTERWITRSWRKAIDAAIRAIRSERK